MSKSGRANREKKKSMALKAAKEQEYIVELEHELAAVTRLLCGAGATASEVTEIRYGVRLDMVKNRVDAMIAILTAINKSNNLLNSITMRDRVNEGEAEYWEAMAAEELMNGYGANGS